MPVFLGGISKKGSLKPKLEERIQSIWPSGRLQLNFSSGCVFGGRRANESHFFPLATFEHESHQGLIMGHLFSKKGENESSQSVLKISDDTCREIIQTEGRYLGNNFWGQYVVFLHDHEKQRSFLFPDPMGLFSAFYTETPEGFFFSSDIGLLHPFLPQKASLDLPYLTATLTAKLGGMLASHRTPFQNIFETKPAEGLVFSPEFQKRVLFWNPVAHTSRENFSKAKIVPTFLDCIAAWKSVCPHICVHLSGGLDSTALLLGLNPLNSKHQKIFALTYLDKRIGSSDERDHAKKVADFVGVSLLDYQWDQHYDFSLSPHEALEIWERPHIGLSTQNIDRALEKLIAPYGETVFWSGHGGDQVFYEGLPENSLVDYLFQKGPQGFIKNMMTLCTLYREPVLPFFKKTLASCLKHFFFPQRLKDMVQFERPEWLNLDIQEKDIESFFLPPFFQELAPLFPAKKKQICEIYEGTFNSDVYEKSHGVATIYPYYSQPLIELGLSMPIYESYSSQFSRFPFRETMGGFFKTDLVWRRSKGDTSGAIQMAFEENKETIQALILDGFLAREGQVNRSILEKEFKQILSGSSDEIRAVLNLIALEIWLKNWLKS